MINLDVPFLPPSLNKMYITPRHRPTARVLSQEARVFQQKFRQLINENGLVVKLQDDVREMLTACDQIRSEHGWQYHVGLQFSLNIYKPTNYCKDGRPAMRAGDTDGYVKLVKDCLFDALGVDDGWVILDLVTRYDGPPGLGVSVTLVTVSKREVTL